LLLSQILPPFMLKVGSLSSHGVSSPLCMRKRLHFRRPAGTISPKDHFLSLAAQEHSPAFSFLRFFPSVEHPAGETPLLWLERRIVGPELSFSLFFPRLLRFSVRDDHPVELTPFSPLGWCRRFHLRSWSAVSLLSPLLSEQERAPLPFSPQQDFVVSVRRDASFFFPFFPRDCHFSFPENSIPPPFF